MVAKSSVHSSCHIVRSPAVVRPGEVVTCVAHVLKPRVKDHLLEVRNKTGRHEA